MRASAIVCAAFAAALGLLAGCTNPFAPAIDDRVGTMSTLLGDQRTIDGLFTNFKYAYTFKDTAIYGRLLDDAFLFVFYDPDRNVNDRWGRDVDMRTTTGLFQNTEKLDLNWNAIALESGDDLQHEITRSFVLTITFNPADVVLLQGLVDMSLARPNADSAWKILRWTDESQ